MLLSGSHSAAVMSPVLLLLMTYATASNALPSTSLYTYVNPLIGTEGSIQGSAIAGGNSFPGASLPWSMAKPGIDTSYIGVPNAVDCNAGFSPLGNVTAISMMHVSGTGGVPTYGLISQMPILGNLENVNLADNMTYWQNRSLGIESSSIGLFKTSFLNGVEVAITSSNHSAYMRYKFPSSTTNSTAKTPVSPGMTTSDDAHVLIDLAHVLPGYGAQSYSQKLLSGEIHLRPASNATSSPSYFGKATYAGGWIQAASHSIHFCGNFSVPGSSSIASSNAYTKKSPGASVDGAGTFSWTYVPSVPPPFASRPTLMSYTDLTTVEGAGQGIGALFSWTPSSDILGASGISDRVIEAKLGISYISAEKACSYIESELPSSMSFEEIVQQARDEWDDKVLSKIEVVDDGSCSSQNTTLKTMLYSAMYQTGLMPTDKTGENPRWVSDDTKPYYDDFYTIWDIYRTVLPLYHLIYTNTYKRIISGLINIAKEEGYLPAGRAANWNGRVQGGTHSEMVLADAYTKSNRPLNGSQGLGELGDIDWEGAYEAMIKDATILPVHNSDGVTFDGATKEGRGALDEYLPLHFITRNHTRSISRGVEYPQNDYAIYSVAKGLNKSATVLAEYEDRSTWWQNQWNPDANTTLAGIGNFTGFPGARNADGTWNLTAYDPLSCGGCGWGSDIYEAKVWETSFSAAPHDMSKVISLMGGDTDFLARLDASFIPGFGTSVGANNDAGSALYNPGNEPSFSTSFLYNYVPGQQWKTVKQNRAIVNAYYSTQRSGYPGNIDGGALPSWLIFNLIGLYPIASQPVYLLSAPFFSGLKIKLFSDGLLARELHITAPGLSEECFYPQRVVFNGVVLDRSWMSHEQLATGGSLVFEMGCIPGGWDIGERPPSQSPW